MNVETKVRELLDVEADRRARGRVVRYLRHLSRVYDISERQLFLEYRKVNPGDDIDAPPKCAALTSTVRECSNRATRDGGFCKRHAHLHIPPAPPPAPPPATFVETSIEI